MGETPTPWKLHAFVASGGYAGWHAVGPKSGTKAVADPEWSDQVIAAMNGRAALRAALEQIRDLTAPDGGLPILAAHAIALRALEES